MYIVTYIRVYPHGQYMCHRTRKIGKGTVMNEREIDMWQRQRKKKLEKVKGEGLCQLNMIARSPMKEKPHRCVRR